MPEEAAELLNVSTSEVMSKIISAPTPCLDSYQIANHSCGLKIEIMCGYEILVQH